MPDFQAFTTSVLKELARRSTRPDDVRALRQAIRRRDLHATIYSFTWICADPHVANWLQEKFYFSGPDVGRAKSPIQNHLNTETAYTDLFSWLASDAGRLRQHEPFCLATDSTVARAKHVLGRCKATDFKTWQRGQDEDTARLKGPDRPAWERFIHLRSRWNLKTLSSDHRVKRFVKFLRAYEAADAKRPHRRVRIADRLAGTPAVLKRDIQRRDFHDDISDPQVQHILAKRKRSRTLPVGSSNESHR
jgi:hypothetical protein